MPRAIDDHEAMEAIQRVLSGTQWDADTLEAIAVIVEKAGYPLRDYNEC